MRLRKLTCPNCGGMLEMKISDNSNSIFCPYCGQQFFVDDEKKTYTINQNININKNIKIDKNIHNRYTNDADVIRAKNKEKENKREWIAAILMPLVGIIILICLVVIPSMLDDYHENREKSEGKISAGYYDNLIGKDYETVEAHFRSAGFTNIELIDLDDSGLAFWKAGKVETISVGGDTSFSSSDFFFPDTKVVISYH